MPGLLGLLEDISYTRGPYAHEKLDEFRGGGLDEGHASFAFSRLVTMTRPIDAGLTDGIYIYILTIHHISSYIIH